MADIKDDDLPLIDLAETEGWVVDDTDEDDPVLLMPDGTAIQTWRENYPYDERLSRDDYEKEKRALQIELLKWQNWTKASATSSSSKAATPPARAAPLSASTST